MREEASYNEIETAALQAVQAMNREYEHQQACQRIVRQVYIVDATREEEEATKEAVRKALAALPIGATAKELEKTEETALAPFKAAVSARKETARLESEKQAQRRAAECGRLISNSTTSRGTFKKNTSSTADTVRCGAKRTGCDRSFGKRLSTSCWKIQT